MLAASLSLTHAHTYEEGAHPDHKNEGEVVNNNVLRLAPQATLHWFTTVSATANVRQATNRPG